MFLSSLNEKYYRLSFFSLLIIILVIFLAFSIKNKRIICILLIFFIVFSIIYYFVYSVNKHVSTINVLYRSILNTAYKISDDIKSDTINFNDNMNSFSLSVNTSDNCQNLFSHISLTKNNISKYISLSLQELSIGRGETINLNAYVDDKNISVKIDDNPKLCYNANPNSFKKNWNKSIYSSFFTIPSYIPDDVNYSELNKLISTKNLFKLSYALNFNNLNIDKKELINNISIEKTGHYPLYINNGTIDAQIITLSISHKYIKNILNKIIKSSSISKMKTFVTPLYNLKKQVDDINDNLLFVNFVIYNDLIHCVETSFHTNNSIKNISLSISDNTVSLTLKDMSHGKGIKPYYILNICSDISHGIKILAYKFNKIIFLLDINSNNKCLFTHLTYPDDSGKHKEYNMVLSNNINTDKKKIKGKDIFKLSVMDICYLYNYFNSC